VTLIFVDKSSNSGVSLVEVAGVTETAERQGIS